LRQFANFISVNDLFNIFHFDYQAAADRAANYENFHIHDHERLLIGIEGDIIQTVNFQELRLTAPYISFISTGTIHHHMVPSSENGKFEVWLLLFKSEFVPDLSLQYYSFYPEKATVHLPKGTDFEHIISICKMMYDLCRQKKPDYRVLQKLLIATLTMIDSEKKKLEPDESTFKKTQALHFGNFLKILEENYHSTWCVKEYAGYLGISARCLNLVCMEVIQLHTKEVIQTRKIEEAKKQLLNTDMTVSEIGFTLGYQDKTYFTKVFKKKTGKTPSGFRVEMRKLLA
jgi:AraC family transcriptional regulator, transcriptional activator of pobA